MPVNSIFIPHLHSKRETLLGGSIEWREIKDSGVWCAAGEIWVNPGSTLEFKWKQTVSFLFFPLEGGCVAIHKGAPIEVEHHEALNVTLTEDDGIQFQSHPDLYCRMLFFARKPESKESESLEKAVFRLDRPNELVPFSFPSTGALSGWIGVFNGRYDWKMIVERTQLLCSVHGAFEAGGILMESRDILCLKGPKELEIEALSEYAIMLCLTYQ